MMTFLYSGEYYCDVAQRAILNRAVLALALREVEYTNARSLHCCAARGARRGAILALALRAVVEALRRPTYGVCLIVYRNGSRAGSVLR
jgi:hypothetical protein